MNDQEEVKTKPRITKLMAWATAAFIAGFFMSLPFVMILGLGQASKGQSDEAILIILIGAAAIGALASLAVVSRTHKPH